MSDQLDLAVRKLLNWARSDEEFSRTLSVSPAQAVRCAPFLTAEERRALSQRVSSWAPHVSAPTAADAPGAASEVVRALARINIASYNQVSHVVRPGETLSSIAAAYIGAADAWPHLRDLNALGGAPRPGARLALPLGWAGHFGNVTIGAAELSEYIARLPSGTTRRWFRPVPAATSRHRLGVSREHPARRHRTCG